MNLLWLVLALTQRWYYLLPLYFFVSAADSITGNFAGIFHTICLFPVPSNTYACRVLNSRSNETDNYVSAVDAGYKTLHDLLSRPFESSLTNHLAEAQISIDDAVFLVKSSKMDCHMQMVEEFNRLEMESKEVNDELVDFRAQSLGATDLVIAASDHLLELLSDTSSLSPYSIFCSAFGNLWHLHVCRNSRHNLLHAFDYTLSKFESTIANLSMQADIVDDGLDGLETHLRAIRDLLSDEAGAVMAERDDIIGNPWHRLGWYRRRLLHYNARLQALLNVKTYRNAASVYVASVRSRLRMVGKELKVLRMLAGEPARANRVLPMKPFVQALRAGVARLRHAQIALSGSFGEERRPMVAPLVEEN